MKPVWIIFRVDWWTKPMRTLAHFVGATILGLCRTDLWLWFTNAADTPGQFFNFTNNNMNNYIITYLLRETGINKRKFIISVLTTRVSNKLSNKNELILKFPYKNILLKYVYNSVFTEFKYTLYIDLTSIFLFQMIFFRLS